MRKMNSIFMFLCAVLINLTAHAQYKMTKILDNGSPEELYNLVVVAEAFTENELPKFEELVKQIPEVLKLNPTYAKVLDKINIYALHTPSVDNSISLKIASPSANDPIKEEDLKDTFFGIYFQNSYRAYFLDKSISLKARKTAATQLPFTDNVIIMVNGFQGQPISGRASSQEGVSVLGLNSNFESEWEKYLLIHELAHALAGLSDGYSNSKEEGFNKSIINDPETIRWKEDLSHDDVSITKASEDNEVYIPNFECVMTYGKYDYFCPVCSNRLENVVNTSKYDRINEIRKVNRTVINDQEYVFKLDWEEVPEATSYEIAYTSNYYDEQQNWKKEIQIKTVSEPSVIFNLENFYKNFTDNITIRAYNDKTSTNFKNLHISLYDYVDKVTIASPEITVEEVTETSCKLLWTTSKYTKATTIRLRNHNGALSEFVVEGDNIELFNLESGATYTIEMIALVNDDYRYLYNTSELSEVIEINLLETTDDKPKMTLYPNPTSEYIMIQNDESLYDMTKFQIYDDEGNLIRKNGKYRLGKKIYIRKLKSGKYFLKFENGTSFQFDKQ